jgi:hypothetical protein
MEMAELLSFKGRRVVVSGCFSGIGRATAKLLLDSGAELHGLDLKPMNLSSTPSLRSIFVIENRSTPRQNK